MPAQRASYEEFRNRRLRRTVKFRAEQRRNRPHRGAHVTPGDIREYEEEAPPPLLGSDPVMGEPRDLRDVERVSWREHGTGVARGEPREGSRDEATRDDSEWRTGFK